MGQIPPGLLKKVAENTEVLGRCEIRTYTHCIIEALTDTQTGEVRWGWYATDQTEVSEE